MSEVSICWDDRVWLVASVLAAGDWPEREQVIKGAHAVHPQAKATRRALAEHSGHPAVAAANNYLASGFPPAALFAVAVRCTWPDFRPQKPVPHQLQSWPAHLAAFQAEAAPGAQYWAKQRAPWAEAVADLEQIFNPTGLVSFLEDLVRHPLATDLVIVPNLIYPGLETVAAAGSERGYLLIPPPKAVGESPPWPYRDEAEGVLATACYHALTLTAFPILRSLSPDRENLFRHAATILFLERAVDETAARFYQMRRQQEENLQGLPEMVAALKSFLVGAEEDVSLERLLSRFSAD